MIYEPLNRLISHPSGFGMLVVIAWWLAQSAGVQISFFQSHELAASASLVIGAGNAEDPNANPLDHKRQNKRHVNQTSEISQEERPTSVANVDSHGG